MVAYCKGCRPPPPPEKKPEEPQPKSVAQPAIFTAPNKPVTWHVGRKTVTAHGHDLPQVACAGRYL